jgi:hypothetical protein
LHLYAHHVEPLNLAPLRAGNDDVNQIKNGTVRLSRLARSISQTIIRKPFLSGKRQNWTQNREAVRRVDLIPGAGKSIFLRYTQKGKRKNQMRLISQVISLVLFSPWPQPPKRQYRLLT